MDNVGTETKAAVAIEDTESVFGEETVFRKEMVFGEETVFRKKQSLERSSWQLKAAAVTIS